MAKEKNKLKTMDAPVYSFWEALYMSFYSRGLYVDVGRRWRGLGLLYFLIVIAVLSIPFSIKMGIDFNKTFDQQIIEPILQVPTILVQDGEASFDKPMPYLVKNTKNQVVLIVDTTGKIDRFTNEYPYLSILINKNAIYFKIPTPQMFNAVTEQPNPSVPLSQSFEKGSNFVFDGKKIVEENSILQFKYVTQAMIYPIVISLLSSILGVLFLVLAFLGQVFSSIFFSYTVSFKQSCRVFFVSSTPMLLALIMMLTFNIIFPGLGFILLAILTAYYSFAIYSLKAQSQRMALK